MTTTALFILTAILTVLSLIGVVLNIKKIRACFYIWAVTNAAWCAVDLAYGIYMQAVLMAVYFGLAIWGIVAWRRSPAEKSEPGLAGKGVVCICTGAKFLENFQKHMDEMEAFYQKNKEGEL